MIASVVRKQIPCKFMKMWLALLSCVDCITDECRREQRTHEWIDSSTA